MRETKIETPRTLKLTDNEKNSFDNLLKGFTVFREENKEYLKTQGDVNTMILFLLKGGIL